ncbi:4-galactosyl-N-acetylglucosaminide 3-alpha-L-fucosyltransferase 9-like [Clavelina lepadiformis]|uniref:4-galactosyl-N-acetylglucosaminide 3-alpha-L-fucosyltransferase 9-like n=1 Tax=Clavelina lepadiformis TaxID=159417 RepID=UPI0040420FE9
MRSKLKKNRFRAKRFKGSDGWMLISFVLIICTFSYITSNRGESVDELENNSHQKENILKVYDIEEIRNEVEQERNHPQILNTLASLKQKAVKLSKQKNGNTAQKDASDITKYEKNVGTGTLYMQNQDAISKNEFFLNVFRDPVSLQVRRDKSWTKEPSYSIMKNGLREQLDDNMPVILVWWPPAIMEKNKETLLERIFFGVCGKCRLTTDRRTLNKSNVVLFDNTPYIRHLNDLPSKNTRRKEQAYVLWQRDDPGKTYRLLENMEGTFDTMFNYTLSYRRDADIMWYIGNADYVRRSIPNDDRASIDNYINQIIASKRRLAVWIVSNCNRSEGSIDRMRYVEKLIKLGLDIDLHGKCYKSPISKDISDFLAFLRPYKFYLAFENSWHCKDYLTEKFWRNGLMANLVPIVWGPSREDVAALAPKYSFIHVEDFESPQKLVEYMHYLDKNDSAYREYFHWKKEPIPVNVPTQMLRPGYESPICKICRVLVDNGGALPHKTLDSSIKWLFGDQTINSSCISSGYITPETPILSVKQKP